MEISAKRPTCVPGLIVKHLKRGTTYTVIFTATLQTKDLAYDDAILVVYRGEDGKIWARPEREFFDGRFEILKNVDE